MAHYNYVVHGAGAIGSVVAARLARAGADVGLVARGEHLAALQRDGLTLSGATEGHFALAAAAHASELRLDDRTVVVLAMKSDDTPAAFEAHRELYDGLPIVCSQNGVSNEQMLIDQHQRVYGCTVMIGAAIQEPGHVWHSAGELLTLGCWPRGTDEVVAGVVDDLNAGDLRARAHEHIEANKWGKLVRNLANAYLALTDLAVQEASCQPADRWFVADVNQEAADALDAAGIEAETLGRKTLREQIATLRGVGVWEPRTRDDPAVRSYPSTWQDLAAGRERVEVDHFNGTIVRLGEAFGVSTPLNRVLRDRCMDAATRRLGPGSETTESLRAAAG